MKKKIVNNMKVIIIILIGLTILFAILGTFNISTKENMENDEPQCYPNSVVDHDYASFNDREDNDKYILKTKIVPPKGTSCPTKLSEPASKYLNNVDKGDTTISSTVQESNSNTSNTSNSSFLTQNITNASENSPSPADSVSSTPESVEKDKKDTNKSNEKIQTNKSNETTTNKSNDSCPPCPACERCPEPAFDCKKVPNYRSPSIGQYLPMPILNDFSKF
jgi:hypothetical protein